MRKRKIVCIKAIFLFKNHFICRRSIFHEFYADYFPADVVLAMKKYFCFIYLFVVLVLGISGASAADIVDFRQKSGKEQIVILVPNIAKRKVFTVPDPDRLVVDVPLVAGKYRVALPDDYTGKLIKAVRFGHFTPQTSRFVFDLEQPVRVSSIQMEGKKLVIEIDGDGSRKNAVESKPIKNKPTKILEKAAEDPQKKNTDNSSKKIKYSKKYKVNTPPTIVIDAGHGGVDPGTIGDGGSQEKDVVLEYAVALKAKLEKLNKYRVFLTRSEDEFIMLRKRVAIARKAGANMFISIHADSAEDDEARGLSVYTVSEQASDKEAEALAARENKSDIIGGMDLSDERAEVADILISLAQRETKNNSALLADFLVANLDKRVRTLPNTHRFAGFAVLKAPDIPSVLIEIGFLSHPQEEKEIKSKAYREKVLAGIMEGIEAYFRRKETVGMEEI